MILIGIDIGQRSEPTGICVAEKERRSVGQTEADHYVVRHLERLPPGTSYPQIAQRLAEVAAGAGRRSGERGEISADATGIGRPVIEALEEALVPSGRITPVYFTHGDRRIETRDGWRLEVQLGKAYLVSRLQVLLQTHRLHLPRTVEAETLARELRDYQIRVEEDANDRYGAFQVGSHDELVTALGLAIQCEPILCGIFIVG